ncbi:MAG TPA: HAD family hydrolase [Thermoanaerobaculia bacterium]|nr:HAD family hydrolase [Thermoanaerobaculia bacterium]
MFDVIAFDADDTLWHNESNFQATEKQFTELLGPSHDEAIVRQRLLETEVRNLTHFGYGVKGFILSMIETAIELTNGEIRGSDIHKIVLWGHEMLRAPVQLLDGVRETIEAVSANYRLMLLTKGDLFDQESKLARSGMGELFSAVEIVSEKNVATYRAIMARHDVAPERFLMIGNSVKSDVLPALEAGAKAIHVPYYTTWAHEIVSDEVIAGRDYARFKSLAELPAWLGRTTRD